MSPYNRSPDIFQATQMLFQLVADVDENGNYDSLDFLVERITSTVTDHVRDADDPELVASAACAVMGRLFDAINDYSEHIRCIPAFKTQAELLLSFISAQRCTGPAHRALSALVNYVKELAQVEEGSAAIVIECFLEHLESAPDLCLRSISDLIENPDCPESQTPVLLRIFRDVAPLSEQSVPGQTLLAQCFARRPSLLMPLIDTLSPGVKQGMAVQLPDLIQSARSPLIEGAFRMLAHLLSRPDDNSSISADEIGNLLDSDSPDALVSKAMTFYQLDSCQALVQFVTCCADPGPDPELAETHRALRRSFAVVELLTGAESRVLIELHGAAIARLLLTEGLNPESANLYHVGALLSHLLAVIPDVFNQTFALVAPLDDLVRLVSHPPIARVLELLSVQTALFPCFARYRLAFLLVDSALGSPGPQSESALALLVAMLEHWTQSADSDVIIRVELLEYIESKAANALHVLVPLLSSLVLYATSPPVITEFSLLSLQEDTDLFDAMCSRIPSFCELLCDDGRWARSNNFCKHRLSLLALIIRLTESYGDTTVITEACWRRFWEWTCDPAVVPLAHIQLAILWRLVFTDVTRLKLLSTASPFFDDLLQLYDGRSSSSTIKSVMNELMSHIHGLLERNELDEEFIGDWLQDDRFTSIIAKLAAQKRELEQQPSNPIETQPEGRLDATTATLLAAQSDDLDEKQPRFDVADDCVPDARRDPFEGFSRRISR